MKLKYALVALASILAIQSAHGAEGGGAIDFEVFRKSLNIQAAKDIADSFNELKNLKDFKNIYGYFLPPEQRGSFFAKMKYKPTIRAEGSTLYFEAKGRPTLTMEIVDVLEQRYRINGKPYTHDLNGNMAVQRDVISKSFRAQKVSYRAPVNPLVNLVVPQAEAIVPLLIVGAAVLIDACVDGGCELLAYAAARTGVFTAARSAVVVGVARGAGAAALRTATAAVEKSGRFTGKVFQYVVDDFKTSPFWNKVVSAIKGGAKTSAMNLKSPAFVTSIPFQAVSKIFKFTQEQTKGVVVAVGLTMFSTAYNGKLEDAQKTYGISKFDGIKCIVSGQNLDNSCSYAAPKVELGSAKTNALSDKDAPWCPTAKVNELQTTMLNVNGGKTASIIRYDVKNQAPVSALRFDTNANGDVNMDSIRDYKFVNGVITEVDQPILRVGSLKEWDLLTHKNTFTGPDSPQRQEEDVLRQVVKREEFLKAETVSDEPKYKGDIIKSFVADPIALASDSPKRAANQEYNYANSMIAAMENMNSYCLAQKHLSESKAANVPAVALPNSPAGASH